MIDDVELLARVTKVLYPVIAKRHRTSPEKAERACAMPSRQPGPGEMWSVLNRTFGYSVDANRGRPTNSSFIAVADQIRLNLRTKESFS